MRDCSSARRAVVSAGSVALAIRRSQRKIAAAIAAPASAGPGRAARRPARLRIGQQQGADQARSGERGSAPRPTTAAHCAGSGARASCSLQRSRRRAARAAPPAARRSRRRRSASATRRSSRAEHHADRDHAVHEDQRAQHDADMADVERRLGAAPDRLRRARRRRTPCCRSRSSAGRRVAAPGRRAARPWSMRAHRATTARPADRIAHILSLHMLGIVAKRRPAVGSCGAAPTAIRAMRTVAPLPARPRHRCPRTNSIRNPRPGRRCFSEPMSELVKRYTASVAFDQRLWRADIDGSLAHAAMLAAQGIIAAADLAAIRARHGADRAARSKPASFEWKLDLEDVHLNIEARLTAAGRRRRQAPAHRPLAQRPGRDRHPPVAARRDRRDRRRCSRDLQRALLELAEQHADDDHARLHAPAGGAAGDVRPPPARLRRDVRARRRAHGRRAARASTACRWAPPRSPAPAIRSTASAWRRTLRHGRRLPELARRGQRPRLRDRVHAPRPRSRWCTSRACREELVLWMSQSFGFIDLADRFCTGSSIMPQKKNPDVPELARGKTGRVVGHLMGAAHADEGPAARLQQGQPGRQGAAVRHRRHAEGHAAHLRRDGRAASPSSPRRWSAPRCRATPPRPTSPTTW